MLKFLFRTKRRSIRMQQQHDSIDCGPCCIGMVAEYHGREYSRQLIRGLCEQDRHGASLGGLARAADRLGFRTLVVRVSLKDLQRATLPCLAYLPRGHFVVVHKVTKNKVCLADPGVGFVTLSHEDFWKIWAGRKKGSGGALLLIEPTDGMMAADVPGKRFGYVEVLRPVRAALQRSIVPFLVCALVLLAVQAALPFLAAALIDTGVVARDVDLLYLILIGQVVLLGTRAAVELLQRWILSYLGMQIDMTLVSKFLRKVSRLPFSFFANKRMGDLMQRVEDHSVIQQLVTESLGQIFLAVTSFVVFGVVLSTFSPVLLAVFAGGSGIYLLYCGWFLKTLRRLNYAQFNLLSNRYSTLFQYLSALEEIKLNNASEYYRWQWERAQHSLARVQVKTRLLSQLQFGGGTVLNEVKNALLVVLAAHEVALGNMTLGTLVAVQYVVGQLNVPLANILSLMTKSNEAYMSFSRAREVHELDDEDTSGPSAQAAPRNGAIRLDDVHFRYRGLGQRGDMIRGVSLTIPEGKTTAIVGRTGGGKTTLVRLLLKMYEADSGRITVGGADLRELPHATWRSSCGVVLQDGCVFSDSILNNITMSDDQVDMARVEEACRIAQADEFIDQLPLKYATLVGLDGMGLSRGQVQRILIARALYRNPKYIFLDEATSALDAEMEARVVSGLSSALEGCTAVIVAHRLSTIRHAHKIVVLNNGVVAEEGDHDTLVRARGKYYELIRHQLEGARREDDAVAVTG